MRLKRQLKVVERATKRYQRPEEAAADGYENTGILSCSHGFSYGKGESFDAEVDPRDPDIITYLLSNKKLELGAVEYVVGPDCEPPNLFNDEGEDVEKTEKEGWIAFPQGTSLHVWVHERNPDGVFAPRNPEFSEMPGCIEFAVPD